MPAHVAPGAQSAEDPHVLVSPAAQAPIRHAVECTVGLVLYWPAHTGCGPIAPAKQHT
jgi:hypothetical protein